jgi:hypothetical protein
MFNNREVKARHLCVIPGKNVPIFLEEIFVGGDLFMRACGANGDFL